MHIQIKALFRLELSVVTSYTYVVLVDGFGAASIRLHLDVEPDQAEGPFDPASRNLFFGSSTFTTSTIKPSRVYYGCYCGPGTSCPVDNACEAKDDLDNACQNHDICYDACPSPGCKIGDSVNPFSALAISARLCDLDFCTRLSRLNLSGYAATYRNAARLAFRCPPDKAVLLGPSYVAANARIYSSTVRTVVGVVMIVEPGRARTANAIAFQARDRAVQPAIPRADFAGPMAIQKSAMASFAQFATRKSTLIASNPQNIAAKQDKLAAAPQDFAATQERLAAMRSLAAGRSGFAVADLALVPTRMETEEFVAQT